MMGENTTVLGRDLGLHIKNLLKQETEGISLKKTMLLKLTTILLVVSMVVGILASCTKKDDDGGAATTTAVTGTAAKTTASAAAKTTAKSTLSASTRAASVSASGTNTTAQSTAGAETDETTDEEAGGEDDVAVTEEKTYDLKGRVLKLVTQYDAYVISKYGVNRSNDVQYKLLLEAEEKYNCKFEFEVANEASIIRPEFEKATMAGVYYKDALRMTRPSVFPKYEQANMILPLNDYIDFSQPVYKQYDQIEGLIYPDKIYAFHFLVTLTPMCVFYNKDMLARDGIPDLHVYADQGIWNWNTLAEIASKLTHDFEGDGIIDQWGFGADSAVVMCTAMLRSNLAAMVNRTADGKYVYNLQEAKALKALQFASDLYHTYKVVKNGNANPDFLKGKCPMYIGTNASAAAYYKFSDLGLNFGHEVLPLGPDNPGGYHLREQSSNMWFFPSILSEPEAAINAFAWWMVAWDESKSDYLTYDDMQLSNAQRWLGGTKDGEMEVSRYMNMISKSILVYDFVEYFAASKTLINNNVFNLLAKERISPAANIESIKQPVQDVINGIMGY